MIVPMALGLPPAHAQLPTVVVVPAASSAAITVNGMHVMRLHGPDAESRAQAVAHRLRAVLSVAPVRIEVQPDRTGVHLVVNGHRAVTADTAQARANNTSPYFLALAWAKALRRALDFRQMWLRPSAVAVAPGAEATVEVLTVPRGAVHIGDHDRGVAEVRADGTDRLVVRGVSAGTVRVPISYEGIRRELVVSVRPLAGGLPASVRVVVTGNPAGADVVQEAVARRLEQEAHLGPGAFVEVPAVLAGPLAEGRRHVAAVPVRVRSPFALPVEGIVRIVVDNERATLAQPSRLYVSNNPERLAMDGTVFRETIEPDTAIRMLYHHKNGSDKDKVVTVRIRNPNGQPARVHLQVATPRAWHDTMAVGHAAARRFLEMLISGAGYVLEIPAGGEHTFTAQRMPPAFVVSGLLQAQLLAGGPLEIAVAVRAAYLLERTVTRDVDPTPLSHPRGIFCTPEVEIRKTLAVGSDEVVEIGSSGRLADLRTGRLLAGDYGVLYRLRLELHNPGETEVEADLWLRAAGGPAYATFVVDGRLVDLSYLAPHREVALVSVRLAPGQSVPVELLTMPEAASSYPLKITLRAR
ncbi:MAG: hypothetical protein QN163_02770 [Armatimonadota bacterium]|nr:hypothetical protein [Armatimonadota bacterium]